MDFSVTITTFNRAESLKRGLEALAHQTYPLSDIEVIVADNGSSDHTKAVTDLFAGRFPNFRYIFDARPGQLVGWHRSFAISTGKITCFIDDDVRPEPTWLQGLAEAYRDERVGLATGPIRLAFEAPPPDWLALMTLGEPGSQTIPLLGGLDLGAEPRDIPGNFVWGTNFSVRRTVLSEAQGFHPCAMPWSLIHFHGDGEVHVGRTAQSRGHRIVYHPQAGVQHDIPAARLTLEAVMRKYTTTGCTRSFQTLRAIGKPYPVPTADEVRAMAGRYFRDAGAAPGDLVEAIESGLDRGMKLQRDAFVADPLFHDFVLRDNYLDLESCYTHPDLIQRPPETAGDWRSGV